jgi:hypothetical protein
MGETLSYASVTDRQTSKEAVASCLIGLLATPTLWGINCALEAWNPTPDSFPFGARHTMQWFILFLYFILWFYGIVVGIVSLKHIADSVGRLRGRFYAIAGIVVPFLWPIVVVVYFFWRWMH